MICFTSYVELVSMVIINLGILRGSDVFLYAGYVCLQSWWDILVKVNNISITVADSNIAHNYTIRYEQH